MSRYGSHVSGRQTPQTEPILGRSDQVKNNAGGFVFAVDDWVRLERFLILGTEGGNLYCGESEMTKEAARVVDRCLAVDPVRTISTIISISHFGRAPKNDPAVFALAMACGKHTKTVAELDGLNLVCRIPTDLFAFCEAVEKFRGWGSSLRKLVAGWYTSRSADQLAYQVTKYRQRNGWTHKDVLRLCHAKMPADAPTLKWSTLSWIVSGFVDESTRDVKRISKPLGAPYNSGRTDTYPRPGLYHPTISGFDAIQKTTDPVQAVNLIGGFKLDREHVPTQFLNDPRIWDALLPRMPLKAMIRNLGKMSAVGLVAPMSEASRTIREKLSDGQYIRKSRLHPMAILLALKVYGSGQGVKGDLRWTPVQTVLDALEDAFYAAFTNVVPTGKRRLLAIDVSGSMDTAMAAGTSLTCREAAAAMAMIVAKTEPNYQIVAFSAPHASRPQMARQSGGWAFNSYNRPALGGQFGGGDSVLEDFDVSKYSRLKDVCQAASVIPMGGTDCSLPMRVATEKGWKFDSFEVYTDNETYASPLMHPCQALKQYREKSGIPAKLIVQAFTSSRFTIADPLDAGTMDVVGLDASAPSIVADFIRSAPNPCGPFLG